MAIRGPAGSLDPSIDITMVAIGDPMVVLACLDSAIKRRDKLASKWIAEAVVEKAKYYAPVGETGYLRESIHTIKEGDYSGVAVDADYGIYVEYGTRKMSAQPFLRPAIDEVGGASVMATAIWTDPELQLAMKTPVIREVGDGIFTGAMSSKGGTAQTVLPTSTLQSIQKSANPLTGNFGFKTKIL